MLLYHKNNHLFVVTLCKLSVLLETKGNSFQMRTQKYWVNQKVCSGFSVSSYRKTQTFGQPNAIPPT